MNKPVLAVMLMAVAALVVLYFYSFGPLANVRLAVHPNPASLKPVRITPAQAPAAQQFSEYHNRDMKENYYRVAFPAAWQVKPGKTLGGYEFSSDAVSGTVELKDVPDNSTLELFVLSREEPGLKKEVAGYVKTGYRKYSVNGNDAYELTYESGAAGAPLENIRTYITGQDQTGVVTLSAPKDKAGSLAEMDKALLSSFKWENG